MEASMYKDDPTPQFTILSRLSVFFSWIGIHRFYVGKHGTGACMILLFFAQMTLDQMLQSNPSSELKVLKSACFIGLWIWQFHDILMISFGKFTTLDNQPIRLTVKTSNPSDVAFGPLLMWACIFGIFGFHRFYAKKYQTGFLQMFTLGGLFVWTIIDIFQITKGEFTDNQGRPIAHDYEPATFIS